MSPASDDPNDSRRVFDKTSALARLDGDVTVLRELSDMFLAWYPQKLADVKRSVQQRELDQARFDAHSILGTLSMFFAEAATTAAENLQRAVLDEQWDLADQMLGPLESELKNLVAALSEDSGSDPNGS